MNTFLHIKPYFNNGLVIESSQYISLVIIRHKFLGKDIYSNVLVERRRLPRIGFRLGMIFGEEIFSK